ncbi:hypothetical protein D3C71_1102020 [compost metagenome]
MHRVLHFLALRPRPHHAQRQLGGLQPVTAAGVVAEAADQHARVGTVVLDQVLAGEIGGGKDALGQAEDHVLLFELARVQPLQVPVDPARQPRQAGVVGVVHQVGRNQGDLCTVGVALVLVGAAEQVVVHTEIDLRRMLAHRVRSTLVGGLDRRGDERQDAGECGRQRIGLQRHGLPAQDLFCFYAEAA